MSEILPHLVYLHGFLSSPDSKKARETGDWLAERGLGAKFHCPVLPPVPLQVAELLRGLYQELKGAPVFVVGSSLGGFYATWFAEEFGCHAVLINPAVRPYELLKDYIGPQRNYQTGEIQVVEPGFADDLRTLERKPSRPDRYWVLLQTGDETLDYRDAADFYAGSRLSVMEGGDHSFVGYADWLPQIWAFARSNSSQGA
ncbi:hypothetical protein SAMN05660284_00380 [Formivibrio citricus]|uniref:Esterase n=1 Tax=Formivibrio citricus TaxID=83765 RepID=A0A1I4VTG9_9NEIS|nr:YqiA/YcfP family alpha/beta fold hydrolase [Formivibrio citricus]SFN04598.1 hypothetical protein SAMN05660284_00380 [Formivibrio citricus]